MSEPAFDELLRALVEAGTRFVLVGGFAVNAWGVVRGTKGLDIVADPEAENLRSLAATAVALGRPDAPPGSIPRAGFRRARAEGPPAS